MKITRAFEFEEIQGFKFGSQPIGKPSLFSHIFFVDGLLIDTGHSNMQRQAVERIRSLPVEQVFLTHHHEDHTGNLDAIQQFLDVPMRASSKCVARMANPPKISFAQWLTWGSRPANTALTAEDHVVKTANYTFELIPIPGHAVDMVALYERNRGWMFSADLWVSEYIRYFLKSEGMKGQIESCKRILEYDFDALLCSHNPQFSGGKEKVARKLQFLEDFYGKVADLHHAGDSNREIMKKMGVKENWPIKLISHGYLSAINMIKAVVKDEGGGFCIQ